MKKLLIILLGCLLTICMQAAIQQPIQNFYKRDYNWGNQNWGVAQQRNGIMYFANMNGLLGYNGESWEHHEIPGIGNNMKSICIASDGDIYIGGHNEFGVFRSKKDGISEYESLSNRLKEEEKNIGEIWHITANDAGIAFQTNTHIVLYANDELTVIKAPFYIRFSAVIANIRYITSDSDGVYILIGTQFVTLPNCDDLYNKLVCGIVPMPDNSILFVTDNHGIFHYKNDQLIAYPHAVNDVLKQSQAFCTKINGNTLAVGTVQNGVVVIDVNTGDYSIINIESGLQNNTVLDLAFDKESNLWLGLDKGISYIKINTPFRSIFPQNNPYGSGYSSLYLNNMLYLGTNQGLFFTTYKKGQISNIIPVENTQGQVYKITLIDKRIYCCHHKGLFEITGTSARKIANIEGVWTVQRLASNPNYLIAGCYKGLFMLKKVNGTWQYSHQIKGFDESSRIFEQDETGAIWMSHGLKGVFKIKLSDDYLSVKSVDFYGKDKGFPSNEHISVYSINNQLLFSTDNGIYSYNTETDSMEESSINQSLMGNQPYYYLKEDKQKQLWFVTKDIIGSALLQKEGKYNINSNESFAIPEALMYEYTDITELDYNTLLISNEDGFTIVNLSMLNTTNIFDVFVRKVCTLKSNKIIGAQYIKDVENEVQIEVPYTDNSLRFYYGTASFSSGKNNQTMYSVRLLGYEEEWSEPTTQQWCSYTNLHEGKYTLQVKTINRNAENSFTEYSFVILAPWYRTIWAYISYVFIAILVLVALQQYIIWRENKLKKQKQVEMEEQSKRYQEESAEKEKEIIKLRNKQLADDLMHKSNDLANSTMNLIRKNEILIDIKNELGKLADNMRNDNHKEYAKKLQHVMTQINENIEHDNDWKKFEENFDNIHQNFMKRLGEQYKGLTMSDKKLCAYLKMNLVSKDIAPLLNISIRGVEISRYRLRKKLNLERDVNLTDFLQNF